MTLFFFFKTVHRVVLTYIAAHHDLNVVLSKPISHNVRNMRSSIILHKDSIAAVLFDCVYDWWDKVLDERKVHSFVDIQDERSKCPFVEPPEASPYHNPCFGPLPFSIDTLKLIAFVWGGKNPCSSRFLRPFHLALITPTSQLPLVDSPVLVCSSPLQTCFSIPYREPDSLFGYPHLDVALTMSSRDGFCRGKWSHLNEISTLHLKHTQTLTSFFNSTNGFLPSFLAALTSACWSRADKIAFLPLLTGFSANSPSPPAFHRFKKVHIVDSFLSTYF